MRRESCPSREELLAYHIGTLPEAAAETVIGHVSSCARCGAVLGGFGDAGDSVVARLRRSVENDPYSGEPQRGQAQSRAKAAVRESLAAATAPYPAPPGALGGPRQPPPPLSADFDPYHQWLGIPPEEQPPHHYRLLGIALFEEDATVIEHAADRQMAHLRTFQTGKRAALSQPLLNEVAAAKVCLLKPEKKAAYDQQLRQAHGPRPAGPPPPPPTLPQPDPMLLRQLGEYKLLGKLGEGGMGAVYKARHTKLNRDVAVKILPKAREADAAAVARFEREAQAIGALSHANIVAAHDAREIQGIRFLVMELLDGLDLEQVVRRCHPLAVPDACELIRQAALGLQCAHEHNLVHRDVKPSNLMLTLSGQLKLLDLGLSRPEVEKTSAEPMTGTGAALGTLDYMAPEQIAATRTVDIRADIYGLGCTLYRLLTGHAPFSGPKYPTTYEKMRAHLEKTPPPVGAYRKDVPAELSAVLNRMLAKEPGARYRDPAEVADAVGRFAAGSDLAALLDRAGHTPPACHPGSPAAGTRATPSSNVTRFFAWLASGAPRSPADPASTPKPAKWPNSRLVVVAGALAASLLVLTMVTAWTLRPSRKAIADRSVETAKPGKPRGTEKTKKPPDPKPPPPKEPVEDGEQNKPHKPPANTAGGTKPPDTTPPQPPEPAKGHLIVDLPEQQRQGVQVFLDGQPQQMQPGGKPIKLSVEPGDHTLRIERPGYEAFTWTGPIDAGKERLVTPPWQRSKSKRAEEENRREDRYAAALKPAEDLLAAWDFLGAAAELAKVQFSDDEQELTDRLAARRSDVQRLAALKQRMIEAINTASPPLKKGDLGIKGVRSSDLVVGADQRGITAGPAGGETARQAWNDLGQEAPAKLCERVLEGKGADYWLAVGLLAHGSRNPDRAEKCFDQAAKSGATTEPYLELLAADAFARAKQLLQNRDFSNAEKELASIQNKYGQLAWLKSQNQNAFDIAWQQAKAEQLYAEAVKLFQEEEFFYLRPKVEELKNNYRSSGAVTDTARNPSYDAMAKAIAPLGDFFVVRQDGKGDFKAIQEAINAVTKKNSLVEIQDNGPYNEPVVIAKEKEGLTLRGAKGCWPLITSAGPRDFPKVVMVLAPGVTLNALVLVNDGPWTDGRYGVSADIQATDRLRIRWCIVKAQSVLAGRVPLLEMEECVLAADTLRDTCGVRNSVFVGNYLNLQSVCENVLVVAAYGVYLHGTAEVRCSTISRLLSVQRTAQGSGVLDCVISSIEAGTSNVRIENCDVYGKTPYVGLAKKGPGCMELDPQFVDPMNLNYRLKPTSPCRNRASDGGDLGFRYTPEIQEVLDKALELRAKGIIKF